MSPDRTSGGGPILVDFSVVASGGSTVHASGFLRALAALDPRPDDVLVALPRDPALLAAEGRALAAAGIPTARIGSPRPAGTVSSNLGGQLALPRLARRVRPSVVFVAREVAPVLLPQPFVLLAANVLRWRPRDPAVAAALGPRGRAVARVKDAVAAVAVRRAAGVVAPSRVIADMLPAQAEVEVIPFGVDLEGSPPGPPPGRGGRPLRVIALGSLGRHKRIDVVIDLVGDLATHHGVDVRLDLWGEAPEGEAARQARDRLADRLGDRGRLRGYVEPEHRRDVLVEADVLVLGSGTESFGFPMLEAMRTSTLVVAPDAPIAREIGAGGFVLYPEGDAREGARRLASWLSAERAPELEGLLAAAHHRAAAFTWERCARETLALLRRAAAPSGAR